MIELKCDSHNHQLKVIYRITLPFAGVDREDVVRWCTDCGAIVIDTEYDGRLAPGNTMRMKFPNLVKHMTVTKN